MTYVGLGGDHGLGDIHNRPGGSWNKVVGPNSISMQSPVKSYNKWELRIMKMIRQRGAEPGDDANNMRSHFGALRYSYIKLRAELM